MNWFFFWACMQNFTYLIWSTLMRFTKFLPGRKQCLFGQVMCLFSLPFLLCCIPLFFHIYIKDNTSARTYFCLFVDRRCLWPVTALTFHATSYFSLSSLQNRFLALLFYIRPSLHIHFWSDYRYERETTLAFDNQGTMMRKRNRTIFINLVSPSRKQTV